MTDLADLERALWLDGAPRFRSQMAEECLMVFPPPAGILRGEAILAGLEGAPRWTEVAMDAVALARPAPGVALLAYRATARRGDGPAYRALCASTWIETPSGWRIALHQHTPEPG